MVEALRTEIRHIPSFFREVICLRDIEQMPLSEVADRLGITVQAAKSRLICARWELRQRATYCFGEGRHKLPLFPEQTVPARSGTQL